MIKINGDYDGQLLIIIMNIVSDEGTFHFTLDISTENNDIAQVHYLLNQAILENEKYLKNEEETEETEECEEEHKFHKETSIEEIYFAKHLGEIHIVTKQLSIYPTEKTAKELLKVILETREKLEKEGMF